MNLITDICYNIDEPQKTKGSERSQIQKITYSMISFIWKCPEKKVYRDSSRLEVVWGGKCRTETNCKQAGGIFWD